MQNRHHSTRRQVRRSKSMIYKCLWAKSDFYFGHKKPEVYVTMGDLARAVHAAPVVDWELEKPNERDAMANTEWTVLCHS